MLYHLFRYLDQYWNIPGSGMFQYLSSRAAAAVILSLLIVIIFGRRIIDFLRRKQIGEGDPRPRAGGASSRSAARRPWAA